MAAVAMRNTKDRRMNALLMNDFIGRYVLSVCILVVLLCLYLTTMRTERMRSLSGSRTT